MSNIQFSPQALRNIGHEHLAWADRRATCDDPDTVADIASVGLLATLLRIADDISALRGMYNAVTMQEEL